MTAYYNEIDPHAAAWLRALISEGHIAPGIVDERSIEDVYPSDLRGFTQCHFFAGIGVWSHALRQSRWSDDRPVWTGSCPCQPFSASGKGAAFADERHLWPAFHHLIKECRPTVVFGEQVASKVADPWVDLVHADLEAMDYAFGCVPFPSAGVGAPHIRDRNYWVADSDSERLHWLNSLLQRQERGRLSKDGTEAAGRGGPLWLADAIVQQRPNRRPGIGTLNAEGGREQGAAAATGLCGDSWPGPVNGFWRDADWLGCRDGKWRPVEPGTFPLAHGAAARVGRLRGYGNAINAEAAKAFIGAYLESAA